MNNKNKKLFKKRHDEIGVIAAKFVNSRGGDLVAQDIASMSARFHFKQGGSAASAIDNGFKCGLAEMERRLILATVH